jgi:hypothetical protein
MLAEKAKQVQCEEDEEGEKKDQKGNIPRPMSFKRVI